jgi:hypothetical protein
VSRPRFLTKSRFKLAHECPTKLFYTGKSQYADQKTDDPFLKALAESGHQVGALAKCYIAGGVEVATSDHSLAVTETRNLLNEARVTIYEGAIQFGDLFIRADIIQKNGDEVSLIEVKAKSFDPDEDEFIGKRGGILSDWDEYVHDIAFQTFVFKSAFPNFKVTPFLYLMNKKSVCPSDGLNQKFLLREGSGGRVEVTVKSELTTSESENPIMKLVDVSDVVAKIVGQSKFSEDLLTWAEKYKLDQKISPLPSKTCANCQFYTRPEQSRDGLLSGVDECWGEAFRVSKERLQESTILDLWDCRNKDSLLEDGKYLIKDLSEEDIKLKSDGEPGLSRTQRQWLQVKFAQDSKSSQYLDVENLGFEMAQWLFPLHFIDFETSAVAIPFKKGQRPYEGVAFQFSHHMVHESGRVEHKGQYLHTKPGEFPSFSFARALKSELDKDYGSILIYSHHENTYLNFIIDQLAVSAEPDREELISFLKTITRPKKESGTVWEPNREMVDLCRVVKRYFWNSRMGGSNSIKAVLPAILNSSDYLKDKYSRPIYGAENGVPSLNYREHQWIYFDSDGKVRDPYKSLPSILSDQDEASREFILRGNLYKSDRLADGGAAMTAWARMQFTEMSAEERNLLAKALLKYCELDTFAMVLLYEAWREELKKSVQVPDKRSTPEAVAKGRGR